MTALVKPTNFVEMI